MQLQSNTKNSKKTQIKIEENNNKISNTNYDIQSFINNEEPSGDNKVPSLITPYNTDDSDSDNGDSDDDNNDNDNDNDNDNKGKTKQELLENSRKWILILPATMVR